METRTSKAIALYLEGKTLHEVGEELSITHERVRGILLGQGISLRKRGPIAKIKVKPAFGKLSTKEKFMALIHVEENGCWSWLGNLIASYGRFRVKGKTMYAHHAAFVLMKGRPPRGPLRSECGIKGCVNPDHWREGGS